MKFVLRFLLLAGCAVMGVIAAAYIADHATATATDPAPAVGADPRPALAIGRTSAATPDIGLQQPVLHEQFPSAPAARVVIVEAPLPPPCAIRPRAMQPRAVHSSTIEPLGIGTEAPIEPRVAAQPLPPPGPELLAKPPRSSLRLAAAPSSPLDGVLPSDPQSRDVMFDMLQQMLQNPDQMKKVLEGVGGSSETVNQLMKLLPGAASASGNDNARQDGPRPAPAGVLPPQSEAVEPRKDGDEAAPVLHPRANIAPLPGHADDGGNHLMVNIQDEDIRIVLEMLSEQGGLNILASTNVQGNVSAVLKDVDVNAALDAILRSTGYVARREGKFIYVGTPQDFAAMKISLDTIGTRVFRPNYISAKELSTLITPLMTAGVGKISLTQPAMMGIAPDQTQTGGNNFAAGEAVLVQDYEAVLMQIEQVVRELDTKPMQVAIEAMILSVALSDEYKFGINLQFLRNKPDVRFGTGAPSINPLDGTGNPSATTGGLIGAYSFTNGGMQFAFLDSTLGAFINALETIGDTNVIATPRLLCLNKQKAEILIGAQFGYVNTTVTQTFSTQSVQFLEVGTQLRIRPFISTDGMIRMEVHPELSTGQVVVQNGFTLPQKEITQVTTNIMCRDGCTVVIGGLMREDLTKNNNQLPVLGSLPGIGFLFRNTDQTIARSEVLVLLTPRIIYDPEYAKESNEKTNLFRSRQQVVADKLSPLSAVHMARQYVRRAEVAAAHGDPERAARLANLALWLDPQNKAAIELRAELEKDAPPPAVQNGVAPPAGSGHHAARGGSVEPWMLDELGPHAAGSAMPMHLRDPGTPGYSRELSRPGDESHAPQ